MFIRIVDEIPDVLSSARKDNKYGLLEMLEIFKAAGAKYVKVMYDEDEYSCVTSAYNAFRKAAKYWAFPVKVVLRNNDVYLVRTDM
jgi:hypothetical protein